MKRRKQIRSLGNVCQREVEEEGLAGFSSSQVVANGRVVVRAGFDGVIENRRIGSEPAHRQLVDIAFERPAFQEISRNVVEPDTLAHLVEQLCCFHRLTWFRGLRYTRGPRCTYSIGNDDESPLKSYSFSNLLPTNQSADSRPASRLSSVSNRPAATNPTGISNEFNH